MPNPDVLPWHVRSAPKRGHTAAEYEDAWAANPDRMRFAVADGASEASYSGLWAQLLTDAFVTAPSPWDSSDWLVEPRIAWSSKVDSLDLSWYAEMKRAQGAFAAFVGVAVRPPGPDSVGRWRAIAFGDSCLLRVRNGRPLRAFPLQNSAEFGNQPNLVASRPSVAAPAFVYDQGTCLPGDCFYLVTDAIAHWFMLHSERDRKPWKDLQPVLSSPEGPEAFAAWVEARRDRDELRNDDVTVLAIGPIPQPATE
jgi:Protein phosphatase 2C